MLKINNKEIAINHFPDGTLLLKENVTEIKKEKNR